jgi:hypothetical protein
MAGRDANAKVPDLLSAMAERLATTPCYAFMSVLAKALT